MTATPPGGNDDQITPPGDLLQLVTTYRHPDLLEIGITKTKHGAWAVLATLRPGVARPLAALDAARGRFEVVYEDPEPIQLGWPATPRQTDDEEP